MGIPNNKKKVKEVMIKDVVTVTGDLTLDRAAARMAVKNIGCLVVVDEKKKPIGIITERDIVKKSVARNQKPDKVTVEKVMTNPVLTVGPEDNFRNIARRMILLRMKRFPVVSDKGLIGILTEHDIVKEFPQFYTVEKSDTPMVRDIFLNYKDGRLITHMNYSDSKIEDKDMFSGMISTLKTLVATALGDKNEKEQVFTYGRVRIHIQKGDHVDLIVVVADSDPEGLCKSMRKVVKGIEDKFASDLIDWDGDVVKMQGVVTLLNELVKKYELTC